ncbi:hypothetical protein HUJ04_008516 [Dendroctonus ponderosae]|nr:hypothetical protein HUJ04_008516 [Dendroctonus ponderosae]
MGYTRYNSLYAHKKYNCPSTTRKRFRCSNCPRNYKHRKHLNQHLKYQCGKPPTANCTFCPKKFHFNFELYLHTRTAHPRK